MPNKLAAMKSLRQDKKRHDRNTAARTEIRSLTKKVRILLAEKKREEADVTLRSLESKLSRAVKKNVIKQGTASRKVSRLRAEWFKLASAKK